MYYLKVRPEERCRGFTSFPGDITGGQGWFGTERLPQKRASLPFNCVGLEVSLVFFGFVCLFIYLFIYFWLCWVFISVRAFSSCGKRGPLFIAVRGPLTIVASLVAEHRLQTRTLSNCGSRA